MRLYRFVIPVLAVGIAGCESLALTAFGLGASAGVTYTMNGIVYRTFTAPLQKLTGASLSALKQMDIDVDSTTEGDSSVTIRAHTHDRDVEIDLEAISHNTTRMRAIVSNSGLLHLDSATAIEIIAQTERLLGANRSEPASFDNPAPGTTTNK